MGKPNRLWERVAENSKRIVDLVKSSGWTGMAALSRSGGVTTPPP
jgi:hypothetical protein